VDGFWIFTFEKRLPSRTIGEDLRRRSSEKIFVRSSQKRAPSRRVFLPGARALKCFPRRAHALLPSFPQNSIRFPPQLKKQNDKESARDMTGYKPSNFDKGFREGKGWGDLVRRGGSRDK
jgi:hypothetical protein